MIKRIETTELSSRKITDNLNMGKTIKELRTTNKMSQAELAKITKTTQPYICSIERKNNISLEKFNNIAKIFGKELKRETIITLTNIGD